MDAHPLIDRLLARQDALVAFGIFAFRAGDLQSVLDEAVETCAYSLKAPFCKICRFRPEHSDLLISAGFGWKPNVVGISLSKVDRKSPGGLAFVTGQPVICVDLAEEKEFDLPAFYAQHAIVSTVNVVIQGHDESAYGILEIDSDTLTTYDEYDIKFLSGFATVVAEAVATAKRVEVLRATLVDKDMLSRELQHRVRNNLHLIYAMLNAEAERQHEQTEQSFRVIARRVQALASVYDHLLGTGMVRTLDFGPYLKTLCGTLRSFQAGKVELMVSGTAVTVMVDLDTATALGLAVTEIITNAYRHAFPDEVGTIAVFLEHRIDVTVLTVADNGIGMSSPDMSKSHGLGLVRRLVEQIGTTVEISSTVHGTRCEIALPSLAEQAG
jgi:two-component sensor histidine kinase